MRRVFIIKRLVFFEGTLIPLVGQGKIRRWKNTKNIQEPLKAGFSDPMPPSSRQEDSASTLSKAHCLQTVGDTSIVCFWFADLYSITR